MLKVRMSSNGKLWIVKLVAVLSFLLAMPILGQARPWQADPGTSWQIQLTGTIDTTPDVDMYIVDLFDATPGEIYQLHTDGRIVICHFSAGSYEEWRDDAAEFPPGVKGKEVSGWPGERWIDIRAAAVKTIMSDRMDLAVTKECDGVVPALVDSYLNVNDTGFPLSYQDQINYNMWLASEAHSRNLSIGLRNDLAQINDLLSYFDWALNEECFRFNECNNLLPFVNKRKAVFGIEYVENVEDPDDFCPAANALNFDWLQKKLDLDAWYLSCRDEYIDLDIKGFQTTKGVSLAGGKSIKIKLVVKNMGQGNKDIDATVVGDQGGGEVYNVTMPVSDPAGGGGTSWLFPAYLPVAAGDINWTVTVDDGDVDIDGATSTTTVKP